MLFQGRNRFYHSNSLQKPAAVHDADRDFTRLDGGGCGKQGMGWQGACKEASGASERTGMRGLEAGGTAGKKDPAGYVFSDDLSAGGGDRRGTGRAGKHAFGKRMDLSELEAEKGYR